MIKDSKSLKRLIEQFKNAEERVNKILFESKPQTVQQLKISVDKEIKQNIFTLTEKTKSWANKDLKEAYNEGAEKIGSLPSGRMDAGLKQEAILNPYIEISDKMSKAAEQTRRTLNEIIKTKSKDGITSVYDVKEAIKNEMFKQNNSMVIQYSNGTKVQLSDYAAMAARTARIEASNTGSINRCKAMEIDLVRCTEVNDCCPYCFRYQGKVYSISGKDKRFPSLYGSDGPFKHGYNIMHPNCFGKNTEVFTNVGWKLFENLECDDSIYTLNPTTKVSEWQKPINYIKYKYQGKMVYIYNKRNDLLVTPNHQLVYNTQNNEQLRFENATDLKISHKLPTTQNWNGKNDKIYGIDRILFCKLMAYYLADGSIHDNSSIKIAQQNNEWMFNELKSLPFKIWKDDNKIVIHNKELKEYCSQFGICTEKYIPSEVKESSKEALQAFILAFAKTDGHIKKNKPFANYKSLESIVLFTTSNSMADDLGEIALKAGYRPSYSLKKQKGKQIQFKNGVYTINNDIWHIYINKSKSASVLKKEMIDYNDFVYCVEVPNHIILVRRNGKVIWCGNCRHEFLPFTEQLYTNEEIKQLQTDSKLPDQLDNNNKVFSAYNKQQLLYRQWREELNEYNDFKKVMGDEMPYTTLGGFRRARRSDSDNFIEAKKRYNEMLLDLPKSDILTKEDRDFLTQYTSENSNMYGPVNSKLWQLEIKQPFSSDKFSKEEKEFIRGVDSALSKLPSYKGETKRYIDLSQKTIDTYEVGSVKTFFGYTSSTKKENINTHYTNRNTIFIIFGKTGKSIQTISEFDKLEEEVLFKRKTNFKVINKQQDKNFTYITIKEL